MILFYSEKEELNTEEYDLLVHVKSDINDKYEIFELFSSKLQFPSYFGKNWDAFYDCLCGLEGPDKKILILHEDLPFRKSEEERELYIDLLLDVESSFSTDQNYKLDIAFPMIYKELILPFF